MSPKLYFRICTRWFKYDRDKLWLVYTQIVPVIFEPPCTSNLKMPGSPKMFSFHPKLFSTWPVFNGMQWLSHVSPVGGLFAVNKQQQDPLDKDMNFKRSWTLFFPLLVLVFRQFCSHKMSVQVRSNVISRSKTACHFARSKKVVFKIHLS